MKFTHRFCTRAPLSDVAGFHSLSESMVAITPPIVPIKMEKAPDHLSEGDQIVFTMWLGPLPVRWHAYVGQVSPTGFTDQQMEGRSVTGSTTTSFVPWTRTPQP
jgi:ligand-binding SRPBCC domain-containing protein